MINKIIIKRFKNIEDITLPMSKINILVGANNAGKSSILQSIQFAVSIAQTTSLDEFKTNRWNSDELAASLTVNQIIYSPIRDIYALGNGGALKEDKSKAISVEFQEKETGNIATFLLRKGRNKNVISTIKGRDLGQIIRDIDNPYSIFVPGLSGIPAYEELKSEGVIRRAAVKGDANNVFRNILWLLKQNESKWNIFIKDFKDIFPGLDVVINFDKIKDEHLNAYIISDQKSLPIDSFGTGVLQIAQILSYIHLYVPKILILDEPDSHLHPSNQKKLAEKLNDLTTSLDFQVVISTHSRHLLDAFSGYATVNWISNGKINPSQYDFISVLLEIGALDRGDILNGGDIKCVVFTEDEITTKLKAVLTANGFDLSQTKIWDYKGSSKLDTAVVIAAFIKQHAPGTTILIHRDRDYLSEAKCQEIKIAAEAAGLQIMFTAGTDIESNLINVNHIKKVYTELSIDQIQSLIDEATNKCEDKSIKNFINTATAEALQVQYRGGSRADSGEIATKCLREYSANKERYRHGKCVYKALISLLQKMDGQKDILVPTEDLKTNELMAIKDIIWPSH